MNSWAQRKSRDPASRRRPLTNNKQEESMHVNPAVPLAIAAALATPAAQAQAQDSYPRSPIRLVIGFAPGGSTDVLGRLIAQKLSAQLGVNVVADNRAGANGNIAIEIVVKATPDGHTLLFNTSAVVLGRALGEKVSYDLFRDLAPIAPVGTVPLVLSVHPALPVNTVADFIAYAKANPGKLTYGSAGTGNITHLGALMFLDANGLTALHVPYKGASPAFLDLIGGRLQFATMTMAPSVPLVTSKRIKALAVTSPKRSQLLPDVPALSESMPGFEVGAWYGVMAPAGTPRAIVQRLNTEILKALQDPDSKARFAQEGAELFALSPEQYQAYLRSELERWSKLIKSAGVKTE